MKIGLIGFGRLGKSFVQGLIMSGFELSDIYITAKSEQTLSIASILFPKLQVTKSKIDLIEKVDYIILCVESQNANELFDELCKANFSNKILISCMADISINRIATILHNVIRRDQIVRAMPNVAIANCNGIIGISSEDGCTKDAIIKAEAILGRLGITIFINEHELEKITVCAASGLAIVSKIMKSYFQAIESKLQNSSLSKTITLQLFRSVIEIIDTQYESFDDVIEAVSTKGGITESCLKNLDSKLLTTAIVQSLSAGLMHIIQPKHEQKQESHYGL